MIILAMALLTSGDHVGRASRSRTSHSVAIVKPALLPASLEVLAVELIADLFVGAFPKPFQWRHAT